MPPARCGGSCPTRSAAHHRARGAKHAAKQIGTVSRPGCEGPRNAESVGRSEGSGRVGSDAAASVPLDQPGCAAAIEPTHSQVSAPENRLKQGLQRKLKARASPDPVAQVAEGQGQIAWGTVHCVLGDNFFCDSRKRLVLRSGSSFECLCAQSIALSNIVVGIALPNKQHLKTTSLYVPVRERSHGCVHCDTQRFAEPRSRRTPPLTLSPFARRNLRLNSALAGERPSGGICAPRASYECRTPFHKNRNALGQPEGYAVSRRSRNARDVCDHQFVQIMVHPHPGSLRNPGSRLVAVYKTATNPFKNELGAA